jgi:hypothetical protein
MDDRLAASRHRKNVEFEAQPNLWVDAVRRQRGRRTSVALVVLGILFGALGTEAVHWRSNSDQVPVTPAVASLPPPPELPAPPAPRVNQQRTAAHRRAVAPAHVAVSKPVAEAPVAVAPVAVAPVAAPAPIAEAPAAAPAPPPEPPLEPAAEKTEAAPPANTFGKPPPAVINVPDDIGVGDHFPSLVPEHPVGAQNP